VFGIEREIEHSPKQTIGFVAVHHNMIEWLSRVRRLMDTLAPTMNGGRGGRGGAQTLGQPGSQYPFGNFVKNSKVWALATFRKSQVGDRRLRGR